MKSKRREIFEQAMSILPNESDDDGWDEAVIRCFNTLTHKVQRDATRAICSAIGAKLCGLEDTLDIEEISECSKIGYAIEAIYYAGRRMGVDACMENLCG